LGAGQPAKNRANEAIKLIEFLSSPEAQQMFADVSMEYPVNSQASLNPIVARWGKFKQDDINIAAAGSCRPPPWLGRAGYK
jgi:iron(III) transport system substrate-binding protein